MRTRKLVAAVIVVCVLVLLLGLFRILCGILVEYWWFGSVGFSSVYVRILSTKVVLWWLGFCMGFGATASGFMLAHRIAGPMPAIGYRWGSWTFSVSGARKLALALCWTAAVLVGLLVGSATVAFWYRVLLFLHRVPSGVVDPIFHNDIGFYFFVYPLAVYLRRMLQVLVWASMAAAGLYYLASGALVIRKPPVLPRRILSHLSKMVGIVFVLAAAGHFLDRYALLYSTEGVAFGAGYTDIHARLPACWIMLVVSLGVACVFFVANRPAKLKLVAVSVAVWLGCLVVFQGAYPGLLQWSRVNANELQFEEPYIKNSIEQTLRAYKLDTVTQVQYAATEELGYEEVLANPLTISNIRLWDWRPMRDTYRQIQEIRPYYDFSDVDVDRYELEGGYTQTMLSLREMNHRKLPPEGQRWVNMRLQYTHGYGLCLSPVNEHTEKGLPVLLIKDIPPKTPPGLDLHRPQIYYGQKTDNYVFVNTAEKEFDYGMGDTNVYVRYEGKGGVPAGSLWRKLIFALQFRDVKILLATKYLVPGSRVMFHRLIADRVRRVAPYLLLDEDPYPVIEQGRIYWIQDAYTISSFFPYSEPSRPHRLNYLRNSVKVVIDAYHGDMTFYVADEEDPLIQANRSAFPSVYRPMSEMPAGLRSHIRYPERMFNIQAQKFAKFHMQDPRVFYNQEDLWDIPLEQYAGQMRPVESYYIIMRLPESDRAEFIVMLPLTPKGKANMIAWLAGRCDGDRYGELIVYRFPKGKIIYGPSQIEGFIDQDSDISQQITLWSQRGSSVIRGNLLVIPIGGAILYAEPLYIQAEESGVPQLKRVITALGESVAMAPTLSESLRALFTGPAAVVVEPSPQEEPLPAAPAVDQDVQLLLEEALDHYRKAQEALREADWQQYGLHMREMKAGLDALEERLSAASRQ